MTFGGWQNDDIYGIELGGGAKNIENGTKSEIDKNDKGMTLLFNQGFNFFGIWYKTLIMTHICYIWDETWWLAQTCYIWY